MISFMWNLKTKEMNKQQKGNRVIDTESKQVVATGEGCRERK